MIPPSLKLTLLLVVFLSTSSLVPALTDAATAPTAAPKNIILMIGDGMGFEHIKAASYFAYGRAGQLSMESLPQQASVTTNSANEEITESGAATTAIATGLKVNNEVLNLAIPGNGSELQTVLEYYQDRCKLTGLVTTNDITDATPAAFVAHTKSRYNTADIIDYFVRQTKPDLVIGGGHKDILLVDLIRAGYTVVNNREELNNLDLSTVSKLFASFGLGDNNYEYDYAIGHSQSFNNIPHLSESTAAALSFLEQDPNGFFLMIEGGRIDHASHANRLPHTIFEVLEFDQSVRTVIDWAKTHPDTLLIVTADHESGGLDVTASNGTGELPDATWKRYGHTAETVPIFAIGPNAEQISGKLDNTDLFDIMTDNTKDVKCLQKTKGFINRSLGYLILFITFIIVIPATLIYVIRNIQRLSPRYPG